MNVTELVRNILTTANMAAMPVFELAYEKLKVSKICTGLSLIRTHASEWINKLRNQGRTFFVIIITYSFCCRHYVRFLSSLCAFFVVIIMYSLYSHHYVKFCCHHYVQFLLSSLCKVFCHHYVPFCCQHYVQFLLSSFCKVFVVIITYSFCCRHYVRFFLSSLCAFLLSTLCMCVYIYIYSMYGGFILRKRIMYIEVGYIMYIL